MYSFVFRFPSHNASSRVPSGSVDPWVSLLFFFQVPKSDWLLLEEEEDHSSSPSHEVTRCMKVNVCNMNMGFEVGKPPRCHLKSKQPVKTVLHGLQCGLLMTGTRGRGDEGA